MAQDKTKQSAINRSYLKLTKMREQVLDARDEIADILFVFELLQDDAWHEDYPFITQARLAIDDAINKLTHANAAMRMAADKLSLYDTRRFGPKRN